MHLDGRNGYNSEPHNLMVYKHNNIFVHGKGGRRCIIAKFILHTKIKF